MKRTRRFFIGMFLAEGNGNIVVSLPDTFGNLISRFAKINMSQKFVSRGSPGARSRNIRLDPLTPFKWSLQIILEGLARAALTISRRRLPPPLLPISAPPALLLLSLVLRVALKEALVKPVLSGLHFHE